MLAEQLTVLESVILGAEPTLPGGRIDFAKPAALAALNWSHTAA